MLIHILTKIWTIEPLGPYTSKSMFDHHTIDPHMSPFAYCQGSLEISSSFKVFVWIIIHQRLNKNEMLQIHQSNRALSPNIYFMCYKDGETQPRLFLHCEIA